MIKHLKYAYEEYEYTKRRTGHDRSDNQVAFRLPLTNTAYEKYENTNDAQSRISSWAILATAEGRCL